MPYVEKMPSANISKAWIKNFLKDFQGNLDKLSEDELVDIIQYANYEYYNKGEKAFHDNIYDLIKERLEKINKNHPILKHVGAVVAKTDKRKVKLPCWMGSMDKIKSDKDTITKWKSGYDGFVVVSDKLDGNSGLLEYSGDGIVKLYTRGNGIDGLDISHIVPFVKHIPVSTNIGKDIKNVLVRGELIISKSDFEKVKEQGANARNMVAGLLNSIKPNLELAKNIQFIAYELVIPHHEPSTQFKTMTKLGFKTAYNRMIPVNSVGIDSLSEYLIERRSESEFEIDGIIVAHDGIHNRIVGENPKHAFAFKSIAMMDQVEVIVTGVEWNISKDGLMKPVVKFDAVNLTGVMVQRATGFNAKFIVDNGVGIGAKLIIRRSGDVIPHIVEITEKAEPSLPTDVAYAWNKSRVDIVANGDNANNKSVIKLKNLVFFFNKVDVHGMSEGIIAKLVDGGYDTVGKILAMSVEDIAKLEGFKSTMANKVFNAIRERFMSVDKVILAAASNVFGHGIGERKLQVVYDAYPAFLTDDAFVVSEEQLTKLEGVSNKTAQVFLEGQGKLWKFVKENSLERFFTKSKNSGNAKKNENDKKVDKTLVNALTGKGFLFTGVRDKEIEERLKAAGASIKTSVSKNVNVLVCKDPTSTSSKMQEARKLGIKIMTLDELIESFHSGALAKLLSTQQ